MEAIRDKQVSRSGLTAGELEDRDTPKSVLRSKHFSAPTPTSASVLLSVAVCSFIS
jgi:hypothetical protein